MATPPTLLYSKEFCAITFPPGRLEVFRDGTTVLSENTFLGQEFTASTLPPTRTALNAGHIPKG